MTKEERTAVEREINRRWEDALRAEFPLVSPPLDASMVAKWRRSVELVHEDVVLGKELAAALEEIRDFARDARDAEETATRLMHKIRERARRAA